MANDNMGQGRGDRPDKTFMDKIMSLAFGPQYEQGQLDRALGNKMIEQAGDRPVYEIPESAGMALDIAKLLAQGGMPGEQQQREDIQASTAAMLSGAQNAVDNPAALQALYGQAQQQELSAYRDLGQRAAMYRANMQQNLQGAYNQYAGFEESRQADEYNRWAEQQNLGWNLRSGGTAGMIYGMNQARENVTNLVGFGAQMGMMGAGVPAVGGNNSAWNVGGSATGTGSYNYTPYVGGNNGSGMGSVWDQKRELDAFRGNGYPL